MSVLDRRYMLGMSIHQGESKSQSTASAWSRGVPSHSLCPQLQTRRPARLQLSQNFEPWGGSFVLSCFCPWDFPSKKPGGQFTAWHLIVGFYCSAPEQVPVETLGSVYLRALLTFGVRSA